MACAAAPPADGDAEDGVDPATFAVAAVEIAADLELATSPGAQAGDELAREVALEVRLAPKEPLELELVSAPRDGRQGALLEVGLRWTDYVGTEPTSFGRSVKTFRPFGDDARFSLLDPLERVFRFEIDEPEPRVLARRLQVTARLHPLDVRVPAAELRSGGARIELPVAESHSVRREPAEDLAAALAHVEEVPPEELFLAAVHEARRASAERVGAIVDALPHVAGPRREALFGALHFLTGETHGRSVARWQEWWDAQRPLDAEGR